MAFDELYNMVIMSKLVVPPLRKTQAFLVDDYTKSNPKYDIKMKTNKHGLSST